MKVTSKKVYLSSNFDTSRELVIVQATIKENSISACKNAIQAVREKFEEYHYIPKEFSAFDCSGRSFTIFSEVISKQKVRESECNVIEYIYMHEIGVDV